MNIAVNEISGEYIHKGSAENNDKVRAIAVFEEKSETDGQGSGYMLYQITLAKGGQEIWTVVRSIACPEIPAEYTRTGKTLKAVDLGIRLDLETI